VAPPEAVARIEIPTHPIVELCGQQENSANRPDAGSVRPFFNTRELSSRWFWTTCEGVVLARLLPVNMRKRGGRHCGSREAYARDSHIGS